MGTTRPARREARIFTPRRGQLGVTVAEACELCAADCEKIASDDSMKTHAKQCRDCAKACRDFEAGWQA